MSSVPAPVVDAATHAIVLSGCELPNPGPWRREAVQPSLDDVELVCDALRVLANADVGFAQVLRRPVGWADGWKYDLPAVRGISTVRRYPDKFDRYGWLKEPSPIPLQALRRLPAIVAVLRGAPANVRLAARRLSLATLREGDDDRTVDACIGIEALLSKEKDELVHRISLRAAAVLATRQDNPANPEAVYDLIKRVYAHRSAVVHGTTSDKYRTIYLNNKPYTAAGLAVFLLREILLDALTRPGGWTTKTLDSTLLRALIRPSGGDPADATAVHLQAEEEEGSTGSGPVG